MLSFSQKPTAYCTGPPFRVALTSCCRALLTRADVASSPSLWAHVVASSEQLGHLCAWLARRRAAVRQLRLAPKQQPVCGRVVASLQHLTLLTHLDLRSCGLEMVPSALCALCSLQRLRLCDNPGLGAWGADADSSVHVPECDAGSPAFRPLQHLTALTRLGMGGCGLVRLPGELSALSSLAHLELPGNQQLGVARGGEGALRPLCHLPSLTRLCLSGCLALRSVPAELKALPSLADLDLACSLEPEEGGEPALEPLRHLSSLTRLAFSRGMVPKRRLPAPLPALAAKGVVEWQY
jgi:Leucine-rich repeat (LRR) protein